jgi:hypothetical protein
MMKFLYAPASAPLKKAQRGDETNNEPRAENRQWAADGRERRAREHIRAQGIDRRGQGQRVN